MMTENRNTHEESTWGYALACSGLGFVLVLLKVTGVIGWSWWIVTAPFWLPFALAALLIAGYFLIFALAMVLFREFIKERVEKARRDER